MLTKFLFFMLTTLSADICVGVSKCLKFQHYDFDCFSDLEKTTVMNTTNHIDEEYFGSCSLPACLPRRYSLFLK